MFKKVLIANRGEIACRVAATLHEMGVRSVAVYSEADRGALHTRVCDEARPIGPSEARESYLNAGAILEAARASGADAVHPGFGFLAENAAFAEAVEAAGLTFIGPTAAQIRAMGDKRAARKLAEAAGVRVVPGAEGADARALVRAANVMGYPVMLKAALGGGGKGMQAARDEAELRAAIEGAQRIAAAAFGDASVYVEKLLVEPRHIEVQVLGDGQGRAVHLFERECTLQRRHQKVVEEAPGAVLGTELRALVTHAAVRLAEAVRYRGAGTIETLVSREGHVYFLEMNTRLQVEHPVTELITGVDLVRAQLEIAATGRLPFEQFGIQRHGHAIEARVYAEDAARGFLPQVGTAVRVRWPDGPFVRVDRGLESGDAVSVYYDPMLAKIIARGPTRESALQRLAGALDDTRVHGVVTNLPFLRALLRAPEVQRGEFDTEWVEREFLQRFAALSGAPAPELALAAVAIAEAAGAPPTPASNGPAPRQADPFAVLGHWRQGGLS
ncbi:MAG TPA: biotin carboxylase N-terminal domain-containing protein [Candidatus Eisenbacteria bacterium]|jgi:acetyl-CoA/propionyl-CoA carboxylase biotin carboxyl carrier protein